MEIKKSFLKRERMLKNKNRLALFVKGLEK